MNKGIKLYSYSIQIYTCGSMPYKFLPSRLHHLKINRYLITGYSEGTFLVEN